MSDEGNRGMDTRRKALPRRDDRHTVAVLGLEDGPEASPGPALLASLDPARFRRIGLALSATEGGFHRPDLHEERLVLPPPERREAAFAASLIRALRDRSVEVLLPGSPRVFVPLACLAGRIRSGGTAVAVPPADVLARMDARHLHEAAARFGIPVARARRIGGQDDRADAADLARFPAILAPDDGAWLRIEDDFGARATLGHAGSPTPATALLIDAALDRMFEVGLVAAPGGDVVAASAVRVLADDERLRPWAAATVDAPDLLEAARRVSVALDIEGAAVLLFTLEGSWRAVALRPGLPHWCEATFGPSNLAEAAIDAAEGTPSLRPCAPAGRLFTQTAEDVNVELDALLTGPEEKRS